ncbi:MAG: peptidylprolyl isomerase, partial [Myxococcota bacterium]
GDADGDGVTNLDEYRAAASRDADVAAALDPKARTAAGEGIDPIVLRAGLRTEAVVRDGAIAVATAFGRTVPPVPLDRSGPGRRERVEPDGTVVREGNPLDGPPAIAELARIRGAVVETSEGVFRIALDPDEAPLAVANFAQLAESGFFDGRVFHRVIPGFVAQTGCPRGDGWGGPGYTIPDEVSAEPYDAGAVGMARSDRDTGGSQWFVTTGPQPHLVGEYTRFGEVTDGLYVVKRLSPGSRLIHVAIERLPAPP